MSSSESIPGRRRMLGLCVTAAAITYLDRACISAAAPAMTKDLGLSDFQMGYAFSAFALAYGLAEIPAGWLSDRIGHRRMLQRIVISWSALTAITGAVRGLFSLLVTRFAFGAAEAGAFPALSATLSAWYPGSQRGFANGAMWMGARFGGAAAPALAIALMALVGWRITFLIFGLLGLVWAVVFSRAFVERRSGAGMPRAHTPWRRILRNRNVWRLFWMYFSASFGFYFFVTWMPTYLMREHGLSLAMSGGYAAAPLAAAGIACAGGGVLSDYLVRRLGSLRWGRALVGLSGFLAGSLGFAAASYSHTALGAVLLLTMAQASLDLTTGVSWATCAEIGGWHGATVAGIMNVASSLAAVIMPLLAAWIVSEYGSFRPFFAIAAVVYMLGALLWLRIDPRKSIDYEVIDR